MKKISHHLLPISLLLLLSIFVHHAWFTNLSPITWGDWFVDYSEKLNEFFSIPMMWNSDFSFGTTNYGISFWPFLMFSGLLSRFNLSPFLIERIVFLWPVTILLPLGMYFLSFYILRSRIAGVVSAIFFEFNTYLIILQGGHLTLLMAIALTPLFLLFFIITLSKNKLFLAVLTSFIGFAISFYEFRIFYLAVWMIFFYLVYSLLFLRESKGIKDFIFKLSLTAIIILVILLLDFYFLFGMYGIESLANNAIFNRTLFGAWYIKLAKTMTIFHFGWTGGKIEPWKIQPLMTRFFVIPILAFFGFVVGKANNKLPFFAFLGVLGIFLAKQDTPPLPDVYKWLFDNVPGFNAFRESGKFLFFVAISYCVLIGSFIAWFWNNSSSRINKLVKIFIIFSLAFIFILNAKPIATGELGSLFVPRRVPRDYLILKNYLLKDKEFFRTFWSPDYSRWGHYLSTHPRTSALYLNLYEWVHFAKKANPIGSVYFDQLLDLSSIKYVLVPLQDKSNDDDFFPKTIRRTDYISELEKLPYLSKVNIGMKEVVIFENYNFRPHIYLTAKKESVNSYVSYQKVEYTEVNPTEYRIRLKNVKNRVYLNFSENFHPSWKLKLGEFNWYEVLTKINYFLSDSNHFQNDAKLNSFLIEPKKICKNFAGCIKNPDGSYNIMFTLYFRPQSYVYFGLIVSSLTFFVCLGYIIFSFVSKMFKNRNIKTI